MKGIVVKNKWFLSLIGSRGIMLFPFILVIRTDDEALIHHEQIHFQQALELFVIPFYLMYLYFSIVYGYTKNPFEAEAFVNDDGIAYNKNHKHFDKWYPNKRPRYAWRNYFPNK